MIALAIGFFAAMILLGAAIGWLSHAAGQEKALRAHARHIIRTEDNPELIAELENLLDEDGRP